MCLLDLVKEDDGVGLAADLFGELATLRNRGGGSEENPDHLIRQETA
jgi:hypothetical protein